MSILCPKCGEEGRITETRKHQGVATRRRVCPKCKTRWNTYESGSNSATQNLAKVDALDQVQAFLESLKKGLQGVTNGTRRADLSGPDRGPDPPDAPGR